MHPSIIEKNRLALEFAMENSGIHDLGDGWLCQRKDGLFRLYPPTGTSLPQELDMQFTSAVKCKKALAKFKEDKNE